MLANVHKGAALLSVIAMAAHLDPITALVLTRSFKEKKGKISIKPQFVAEIKVPNE